MLIWIASYPRSGNHLLRMILRQCFDLGSYTIYQDRPNTREGEILREAAAGSESAKKAIDLWGGLMFRDAGPDAFVRRARTSEDLFMVKSHEPELPDRDRVIYVVRDARAVFYSFQRYLKQVGETEVPLAALVAGLHWPGNWADHVDFFLARDSRTTLVLRYEDLVSETPPLEKIQDFIGVTPTGSFDIAFDDLKALDPRLFSVGNNQPGIEAVERDHADLFWRLCGPTMLRLGYERST